MRAIPVLLLELGLISLSTAVNAEVETVRSRETGAQLSAAADTTAPVSHAGALEEIVVTGTHLRGRPPIGSPLLVYDRKAIERSGVSTTEQFLKKLTQEFGAGASEATLPNAAGGEGANLNSSGGTGANLRGLGNKATLVLLNGRRLAPAGIGDFVDLSIIPLAAIERVEILTDGASAIYGADAVAGVINFILREDFDGFETHLGYGGVTKGDLDEFRAGQLVGGNWGSGSALLDIEYYDRSRLDSSDRETTANVRDPSDLLGAQTRRSALLAASQRVGERIAFFVNGLYSEREAADRSTVAPGLVLSSDRASEQSAATIGASLSLPENWEARLTTSYARSDTEVHQTVPAISLDQRIIWGADNWASDLQADGALASIPGGAVRLAMGAHYRLEHFRPRNAPPLDKSSERDVYAIFGEIAVPLVGDENAVRAVERLDLSLAGRYENYSDFGSTLDPKIGLAWTIAKGFGVRGSYGTSFRAPLLYELTPSAFNVQVRRIPDPAAPTGNSVAILLQGNGNPDLRPEQATTWTAGLDWLPTAIPGFVASATYFHIDFEDRIGNPIPAVLNALQEEHLYSEFILRAPALDHVVELFSAPFFSNIARAAPTDVTAIVDNRIQNVAARQESGIDVSMAYEMGTSWGTFNSEIETTYLIEFSEQASPAAAKADFLNVLSRPVDFRARGTLAWTQRAWSAALSVNYTDNYRDNRTTPNPEIDSWTTVDATVAYESALLGGIALSLSGQNIFDSDPPKVQRADGYNYDPTNANALGRFVAVEMRKRW